MNNMVKDIIIPTYNANNDKVMNAICDIIDGMMMNDNDNDAIQQMIKLKIILYVLCTRFEIANDVPLSALVMVLSNNMLKVKHCITQQMLDMMDMS